MDRFSMSRFIVIILLLLAFKTQAEEHSSGLSLKWNNISQQQFIDNLVVCETSIQSFKWDNQIWPKTNNQPKPSFASIIQRAEIRQKILNNLKKQAILTSDFNLDITSAMVQHDLNRMAQSSRSPQKLNQLFKLLGNDPQTIAQCISRPYLVKKKFSHIYNHNNEIHADVRSLAQQELKAYQTTGETKNLKASITQFSYRKENSSQSSSKYPSELSESVLILNVKDYSNKLKQLHHPELIETDYGFNFETVIAQSQNQIDVISFNWPKQAESKWLDAQTDHFENKTVYYKNLQLPTIASQSKPFDEKSVMADSWIHGENVPEGRRGHTAIWTGDEMIIWGGIINGYYLNSGARYNPVTDSWVLTDIIRAPSARAFHTAIWTGSEMIIWGGEDMDSYLNTGARYNPKTNSWKDIDILNAPIGRRHHTAIWTGSKMIIWGGYRDYDLKTGGSYDLSSDTWAATNYNDAPHQRSYHSAIWTGDEMIIWGNFGQTGARYNPSTDSWIPTSTDGAPRGSYHSVVWTGTKMIVWGGDNGYANAGGLYNPDTDSWEMISKVGSPITEFNFKAIWTGTEMIVWGGNGSGADESGGRYNPNTNTWILINNNDGPSPRNQHSLIWTGEEMIVWGGGNNFNTGARYKPSSDEWISTAISVVPDERFYHTAVWTGVEMIIWGGFNNSTSFNTGGRYNPITNTWNMTQLINAPSRRGYHTALWSGSEMLVWGGMTEFYTGHQNSGGRYNPLMDSWDATEMTNAPSARALHTAVWTGQEMIIWGGDGGSDTGGRYNPSTGNWLAVENTNAPSARYYHSAIWTGDEMIIWGGWGGQDFNTGGHYNPDTGVWTATETTDAPTPRREHTALWDGTEMIVWGAGAVNDNTGGRYDTSTKTWTATEIMDAPDKRKYPTAVLANNEMIVWGGEDANAPVNSGGRYNLATNTWIPTTTLNAPIGRIYHTAVWTGDEMIVWGGNPNSATYGSLSTEMGVYVTDNWYAVAGYVNGLLPNNPLSLQLNGGSDLIVSNEGTFMFLMLLRDGESYSVTIDSPATDPIQPCQIINSSGQIIGSDVSNIELNCQMGDDLIFSDSFD